MSRLSLTTLSGIPEIAIGDNLGAILAEAGGPLRHGDVIAVAQKIVSKAEGRIVDLSGIEPSAQALKLAAISGKRPELVELILRQSEEVVRCTRDVLIVRHKLGFVVANAAIDQSNVQGEDCALLLPEDPDRSATELRAALRERTGADVAVLIIDSFGRAWREGVCGMCIGVAGLTPLIDERGMPDRFGRPLQATQIAVGDELAAAASLMMGQAAEGTPAVLIRGAASRWLGDGRTSDLIRPKVRDLFQ
ncbi:coenzyme F420-0:L-glutamate ligase [Sphingobium sp. MK2]|uniref:coenzyme F420-0:L-glutamate ligase n=1 Tax=Sphingobium sp. MK2 TaxID=3116540 RepID=UPI0032E366FE